MKFKFHSACLQLLIINYSLLIISCSFSKQISKSAHKILINDSVISTGHIGISIYAPGGGQYWYNYNATKYFIPASNTKLFTLYAAMKYLGDSLAGLEVTEYPDAIIITATGDPTLLHPDFKNQPVYNYLLNTKKQLWADDHPWKENALGNGWAWDDFNDYYMAERSVLPIFGNVVRFKGTQNDTRLYPAGAVTNKTFPVFSKNPATGYIGKVTRDRNQNFFALNTDGKLSKELQVPFITSSTLAFKLLEDTLHKNINGPGIVHPYSFGDSPPLHYTVHSQPVDSVFKLMMHRSDNFFAEQLLLMVSNKKIGYMNDNDIIDTLLNNDLKNISQKPNWIDGSGLSRYNLFTPLSLVSVLTQMKTAFGLERIKNILPTGGEGTLASYYRKDSGHIYAKTGTISNNTALSGYLITKKNKLLIFSILVNNITGSPIAVKQAIEHFLDRIIAKY